MNRWSQKISRAYSNFICYTGGYLSLSVQFSLSHVWFFVTPWTAVHQASLSITNFRSPHKPMSIESVMPSNHLTLCHPFLLLPPILPSISLFQWVNSLHEVAKVTSVMFNSFRLHGLCNLPSSSVHGFPKQEYWSGLPFPFPEDLPNPGIEPGSLALQADSLPSEPPRSPERQMLKYFWKHRFCRVFLFLLLSH